MQIIFRCPKGHKIRAKSEWAGRKGKCPACGCTLTVPEIVDRPKIDLRDKRLSESAVMQLLGEVPPPPPPPPKMSSGVRRHCPRCRQPISVVAHVCNHCNLYVGPYIDTNHTAGGSSTS